MLDGAREAPLSESDHGKLRDALHALAELVVRTRNTQKTSAVVGKEEGSQTGTPPDNAATPPPGHGRNGAEAFGGARKVAIRHQTLTHGDLVDSTLKADMAQRVMKMLDRAPDGFASRFTVQAGSRIQIVTAEDVEWIGAAGDYVELHVNGRSYLLRETMASLEQRFDPAMFIRIHRSRIV